MDMVSVAAMGPTADKCGMTGLCHNFCSERLQQSALIADGDYE